MSFLENDGDNPAWLLPPLRSRSQAELVVDAILERAAKGLFLPGDRLVEVDWARDLGVGRVPVRDAVRKLESQGILVSTPDRCVRLMDVSVERLRKILKVRLTLEKLAVAELRAAAAAGDDVFFPLAEIIGRMREAASIGDRYGVACIDTEFHRTLVELSGNETLVHTWGHLARHLTIYFGLSTLQKRLMPIVEEHELILRVMRTGTAAEIDRITDIHLMDSLFALDHSGFVERLRMHERRLAVPA